MSRDEMRAGDSERQEVADRLKAALDEGRLDLHEYDERLGQTYAAKTYGDLDRLVTDLPGPIPAQQSRVERYQQPAAPAPVAGVGARVPGRSWPRTAVWWRSASSSGRSPASPPVTSSTRGRCGC
jgi:Domain of unknown function (DUF1707)